MKFAWDYLKKNWKKPLALLLCGALYALVFSLYRLPVAAAAYGTALCLAFLALVALISLARGARRHRLIRETIREAHITIERLPEPAGPIEADYWALAHALEDKKRRVVSENAAAQAEIKEYYTLWAHQVKTPIAAMRLILQGEDTDESRELAAQLLLVEQYVEMALAYVRADGGASDFLIRRCDLDGIVRQAVHRYAPLFIRKRLSLEIRPLSSRVVTDEKWLCFVIEQIISNAVKYTRQGGVVIGEEPPGVLVIRDTGIGIAPEDLPRVGEKGFTGRNGREDKRATGIGLYLCRKVLGRLGHSLSIESEPGRGTKVRIDLRQDDAHTE